MSSAPGSGPAPDAGIVLAVSGMTFESRIAAGPRIDTLHGYRAAALARALADRLGAGPAGPARPGRNREHKHGHGTGRAASGPHYSGVISFGVAGGLDPALPPGTVIVATEVRDGDTAYPADLAWSAALRRALPMAASGPLAGADAAVVTVADKSALHRQHGALAVDMESHLSARVARDFGVPFVAVRVVVDPADRPVPPLAVAGMAADGSTDIGAIVLGLLKAPHHLGGLLRLARDASAARAALQAARRALGDGLALPADAVTA